jgi:hypothetical protein
MKSDWGRNSDSGESQTGEFNGESQIGEQSQTTQFICLNIHLFNGHLKTTQGPANCPSRPAPMETSLRQTSVGLVALLDLFDLAGL